MRVLGVDHGQKRIGLAVSDETGTLARPLSIVRHTGREEDAERVGQVALEQRVELIVIGQSFDEEGRPNAAGRSAGRFAEALRARSGIRVVLWDESMSTQDARAARIASGARKKARTRDIDAQAAAIILQSYLDTQASPEIRKIEDRKRD